MTSGKIGLATERNLAGLGIVVTRAQHQAEPLCRKIEDAEGRAIRLPMLEIREVEYSAQLGTIIDHLSNFHIAVFISSNAVRHAFRHMRSRGVSFGHLRLVAIGRKTAQALEEAGYQADICPQHGFTSEDLLKLDELQSLYGRQIVVFRGEGGRELLAETLIARGAQVAYAEVYQRVAPSIDQRALEQIFNGGSFDLITISSAEGLKNLLDIVGPEWALRLRQIPLLVGGQRMLQIAGDMGFNTIINARDPSDEAIFEGILQWSRQRREAHG
jgi:uroporphyrinogen-III synthase